MNLKATTESMRLFAYCHDGVGIGHLARTTAICRRLKSEADGLSFLVATGTPYVSLFESLGRADYIKLPALEKVAAGEYRSKYFALPAADLTRCRSEMVRSSVEYFSPTFVLVDKAPLGVQGELIPTLKWLKANRPATPVVFGMRDIEDAPQATVKQWRESRVVERLIELFDEIWVYGMRDVFDVAREYQFPKALQDKLRYVGYITPRSPSVSRPADDPYVVVTVGGGTDGESLLRTYLDQAARTMTDTGIRSILVSGPDLPADAYEPLHARALSLPNVAWIRFDPNLDELIRGASLVVCMGGYNTLCQVAMHRKRALVVPRSRPRQEQLIRARLWAERGIVDMIDPDELSPRLLAERALGMIRSDTQDEPFQLDLAGLNRVAIRFKSLHGLETQRATAVRV